MNVEKISSADAKGRLTELIDEVRKGSKQFIIEDMGQPVAALVTVDHLDSFEYKDPQPEKVSQGLLALMGAWGDIEDETIDRMTEEIYAAREADQGRPVEFEE